MSAIQLLYAQNIIARKTGVAQQSLSFSLRVADLAYDKQVEVWWRGEDGAWRLLPAEFHYAVDGYEVWQAQATFDLGDKQSLPGNVRFALRYRAAGTEQWDNNNGRDYQVDADSGVLTPEDTAVVNIGHRPHLELGQKTLPVTVAIDRSLRPRRVFVRWSSDGWQSYRDTACSYARTHWDVQYHSNARNPNQYGRAVWHGRINVGGAQRVAYAIACETKSGTVWDNNYGANYVAQRARLKVLTLNLHTYQEADQDAKFSQIARAINDLDVDIVCLQEVGEHWNNGHGDWQSNAARIIRERLKSHYYLHTDWSHRGFDHYREGVAILSRYPFLRQDSGYVSASHDPYSIHSRKIVTARVRVPFLGQINIFSVHLSWWEDGFAEQFGNLVSWARHAQEKDVVATLLCGDFNVKAGSRGYDLFVRTAEYEDQFLRATAEDKFRRIFRQQVDNWPRELADDQRIDYILLQKNTRLRVAAARVLFTDEAYGRVSDHPGYYAEFELK